MECICSIFNCIGNSLTNSTFWVAIGSIGTWTTVIFSTIMTIREIKRNNPQNWLKTEKAIMSIDAHFENKSYTKLRFYSQFKNIGPVDIKIKKAKIYLYIKSLKKFYSLFFYANENNAILMNEIENLTFVPLMENGIIQSSFDNPYFVKNIQEDLINKQDKDISINVIYLTNIGSINYVLSQDEVAICLYALRCLKLDEK